MKVLALLVLAVAVEVAVAGNTCRLNKPCPVTYVTKGCFKDLKTQDSSNRVLPNYIYNERDSTASNYGNRKIEWYNWDVYIAEFSCRCAERAKALGYDLFGVQFYGECWAGHKNQHNYKSIGASTNCLTDNYRKCTENDRYCAGEQWTNFVYEIVNNTCSLSFETIGCYKDNHNSERPLADYVLSDRDSSVSVYSGQSINWISFDAYLPDFVCRCAQKAKERGTKYFGVQFYGECWTAADGDSKYSIDGPSPGCVDNCYKDCPGFEGQICTGKQFHNYVYRLKEAGEPSCDVTYTPIGCYAEQEEDRALRTVLRNSDPKSDYFYGEMRTEGEWGSFFPGFACDCARLAKNKGYEYFGVSKYGECYSDIASENYSKHGGSSACREGSANATCSEGSKLCAGPDGNSNYVYQVTLNASPEKKRSFIPAKDPFRTDFF